MNTTGLLSAVMLLMASMVCHANENLSMIKIIATGGTIAHTPEGRIDGESLTRALPQLRDYAGISVEEYSLIISTAFETEDMLKLSRRINELLRQDDIDGVVVTMGSNAIEEMAYFMHLTVKSSKPVVFTGAQRKHGTPGSDGEKNLLDAVRVAALDEARGMGVMVVVNEEIHAARDVTKTVSYRTDTWSSGDIGNLGFIDTDRVTFYRRLLRKHTTTSEFDSGAIDKLPEVYILYSYVGADGTLARAAVRDGKARGIVLAGFPSGAPAKPRQHQALDEISRQGVTVVISHRGGTGRVRESYASLDRQIEADNLSPQKARVLLMLALTRTDDPAEIQRMFDEY